jgi:putative membrane protein
LEFELWGIGFVKPKFENAIKALLLLALGFFLYSRLASGTLFFYISQRFMGFTLLAIAGLIMVGLSYRFRRDAGDHDHEHAGHTHSHGLTWGGVALVLLPVVLGLLVPPQPLGASALANREINSGLEQSSMPGIVGAAAQIPTTQKNILDWWKSFRASPAVNEDSTIVGQPARLIGFVHHDDRYGPNHLMVVRYMVSCCVADASALGLVVASPDAAKFESDQWVEVSGRFAPGDLAAWKMPVLVADSITPVAIPDQPYLYP